MLASPFLSVFLFEIISVNLDQIDISVCSVESAQCFLRQRSIYPRSCVSAPSVDNNGSEEIWVIISRV